MINTRDQEQQVLLAIQQGGQGAEVALRQIYFDNRQAIGSFIQRNRGNEEEAKDVMQEAVIAFYENVKKGKFKGDSTISTYLFSIARFIWLNKLKRKNLELSKLEISTRSTHEPELPKRITEKETKQQLSNLFSRLGADCQNVLMYNIYHNMGMKEIAQNMQYDNEQIARNKKYLCMKKLKEMIKQYPYIIKKLNLE